MALGFTTSKGNTPRVTSGSGMAWLVAAYDNHGPPGVWSFNALLKAVRFCIKSYKIGVVLDSDISVAPLSFAHV